MSAKQIAKGRRGFTLIELLICVAIIAIITAMPAMFLVHFIRHETVGVKTAGLDQQLYLTTIWLTKDIKNSHRGVAAFQGFASDADTLILAPASPEHQGETIIYNLENQALYRLRFVGEELKEQQRLIDRVDQVEFRLQNQLVEFSLAGSVSFQQRTYAQEVECAALLQ